MKRFILAGLFVVGCFAGNVQAAFTDNEFGVSERPAQENDYEYTTSKLFDAFSLGNSYGTGVFAYEGGGTSSTAGKVNIAGYDDVLLYYNMGTWSASNTGTYTLRLYVQSDNDNFWANLNADTLIGGTNTGTINISETGAKFFRAGLSCTVVGTQTFWLTMDKRRKKR